MTGKPKKDSNRNLVRPRAAAGYHKQCQHNLSHHNQGCDCGCEGHGDHVYAHNHNHGSHEHGYSSAPIKVTTHDAAVIGSISFKINISYAEAFELYESRMKVIAAKVQELEGIIGHIKGCVTEEGSRCMISITDEEAEKKHMEGRGAVVEGVAIVFGITPGELEGILVEVFSEWI